MPNLKFRRNHYHNSPKAGIVYCDSSYELKAALLLDEDSNVITYETQQRFYNSLNKLRILDFLTTNIDGKRKLIEVKPERRLDQFVEQIQDNKDYAKQNGYDFELWTENKLGFKDERSATKWADEYLSKISGIDYVALRKTRACTRVKKYYHNKIATDKVTVECSFCDCQHEVLRKSYENNLERNGRYICEREGGKIAGSLPKKQKVNPHAVQGQKECTKCTKVLPFDCFGLDKSRSDGYSNKCRECRKKKNHF